MSESGGRRRKRAYDFEAFRGYRGPRFTPIPDEFLDHQLAYVSSAEAKVMLFLFRKTYGYRKSGDRVSLAQLEFGTVASDGTIIDRGTGLSRATIWRALKGLQEKGLIEVHRQTTPLGDSDINYYRIREDGGPFGSGSGSTDEGERGEGSSRNETTPSSELNHRPLRSKPRGGFSSEPTRTDSTREDFTQERRETGFGIQDSAQRHREQPATDDALEGLAREFLQRIGYAKPASAKRQRTLEILRDLQEVDGFSLDELRTACDIAAAMNARGPELIPHIIGRGIAAAPESGVGKRLARDQDAERTRWRALTAEFEALPDHEQHELIGQARQSNPVLRERPEDHPLVRAAAIALLDEN